MDFYQEFMKGLSKYLKTNARLLLIHFIYQQSNRLCFLRIKGCRKQYVYNIFCEFIPHIKARLF